MAGLNEQDMKALMRCAYAGNRGLYFNFPAKKEGNDGYGQLAPGVVRNVDAPAATAGSFTGRQARVDAVITNSSNAPPFPARSADGATNAPPASTEDVLNMTSRAVRMLLLAALLPLAACARQPAQTPVELTQTNEQGCTRQRSVGPQDAYADPAPLKQACVGPYLLELPQNYFDNQIGTEHDGSFGLALEYPSLEAFKPGDRIGLSVDQSLRTIDIDFSYSDRFTPMQILERLSTPQEYDPESPTRSLGARIEGEPQYGLTPYYVDLVRVRAHYRAKGMGDDMRVMKAASNMDWFISTDPAGRIDRLISCTSREQTDPGYAWINGIPTKTSTDGMARCEHRFVLPDHHTIVKLGYLRDLLPQWQQLESRASKLFFEHKVPKELEGHGKAGSAGVERQRY